MSPANNSFFTPPRRQAIPRPLIARTELEPIQVDSDSEPEPVVISKKTTTAKAGNKNKVVIVIDSDSENDNDETCTQSTDVDLVSTSSSATIRNEHNLGLGEHSAKISHYQLMDVDIPEDTTVVDTSPTVPVDYLHAKENVPKDTIVVDTSRLSILASENGVDTDDVDVDDDDAINLPPSMPSSARYATYNSPSTPSTPPPRNGRITKIGYPSYDIDTPNKTRRSSRFLPHIDISSATGSRLKRKHDDDETYSPRRNRCLRSKTSSPSTRKSRRNITQRSGSHAAEGSTLLGNSAEDVPEL
ncbi:hypothetical protein BJ878DRAFT_194846 [Calycina marina]|uniref:Uncharacterized protein n=1 Tax=Calycina marina TaxID=1763456 RepID=A0A9P7Z8Z6_9HELO|nr:hypothetical protein BJ878DRAFT_194846 [Calycina marina]